MWNSGVNQVGRLRRASCRIRVLAQFDFVWCDFPFTLSYIYMHRWMPLIYIPACTYTYIFWSMYMHTCICTYTHIYTNILCSFVYICTHILQNAPLLLSCPCTLCVKHRTVRNDSRDSNGCRSLFVKRWLSKYQLKWHHLKTHSPPSFLLISLFFLLTDCNSNSGLCVMAN